MRGIVAVFGRDLFRDPPPIIYPPPQYKPALRDNGSGGFRKKSIYDDFISILWGRNVSPKRTSILYYEIYKDLRQKQPLDLEKLKKLTTLAKNDLSTYIETLERMPEEPPIKSEDKSKLNENAKKNFVFLLAEAKEKLKKVNTFEEIQNLQLKLEEQVVPIINDAFKGES
jgi:hypothetical protein